jgi:hypothetical protein
VPLWFKLLLGIGQWLGLVACLGAIAAWYSGANRWGLYCDGRRVFMVSPTGFSVITGRGRHESTIPPGWHIGESRVSWFFRQHMYVARAGRTDIFLPAWLVLSIVAVPTGLAWILDRRRRVPPGGCTNCGYDLTGNVSGRCPECGHQVPPRSAAMQGTNA